MMNAVSHALVQLRGEVLGEAVPVSLDAPNRPWTQAAGRPTVNLFLYDVRENLARREVMLEPVRDSSGVVVRRRDPADEVRPALRAQRPGVRSSSSTSFSRHSS